MDCGDGYSYSMNVVEQANPNKEKKEAWKNIGNAISCNDSYANSYFRVDGSLPEVLAVADFGLDIPDDAYIKSVRFEVKIRITDSNTKVKSPTAYFMLYGGKGKVNQQKTTGKDGWYGSTYRDYATKDLSTSWQVMTYTIYEDDWNAKGFPSNCLNMKEMGIDLHFEKPSKINHITGVWIGWVRVKVDYVVPNYRVTYSPSTSVEEPLEMLVNQQYCVDVNFENTTVANGGEQTVDIELPFGTSLKSYSPTSANFVHESGNSYKWTVDGSGLAKDKITLCLNSEVYGFRELTSSIDDKTFPYYIYPFSRDGVDFGEMAIESGLVQKAEPSCFKFFANTISSDTSITYTVVLDGENQTDWSKVSSDLLVYYNNTNQGNCILTGEDGYLSWELGQESQAQGVSIDWANTNNNQITFTVPKDTEVDINWTGCFIPLTTGENTMYVVNGDTGVSTTYEYNSLAPNSHTIDSHFEDSIFYDWRVLTQITNGAYFITMASKPTDMLMIQQECSLKAHMWKDLAYIGCVPIQHAHYEPEHDTSNDGISESFKNITYKGKKMEIEESTSLKIKAPPRDWTTWKGLVELDKPIPVNTVPTAFEGDVLNHRGWAEITGIKGVSKTNPLYYDGEIELDYLTHNINTRFTIERGGKSFDVKLDNPVASVLDSGEEFAKYTYINEDGETVTNSTGYFIVDTDGAYIYDSDMSEESRTLLALDNKQYVTIQSENPFTENAYVTMRWHSTKIAENRENKIDREIYLLNEDGKIVFKYVYHDYDFDTNNEYYSCMVKAEKQIGNNWIECINKKLYLNVDVESLQLKIDENGHIVQESTPNYDELIPDSDDEEYEIYEFNDFTYGSSLTFKLNGNTLDIIDSGLNGRNIVENGIVLEEGNYKLQVVFKNNNSDSDTVDVITFFDFEVSESILSSDFGLDYGNMYISSFPIADKTLMFTRLGEDGTIYYFKGEDNEEFSYIQEPFYMYAGGVDLTAGDGQSIFNLNNSYTIFYMQNGLVRIGFNRLNGELYIAKYDSYINEYINVARLQAQNKDFTVGSYSDDKIQIVAGTTVYSMYRGHPYIVINHPDEDIDFEVSWDMVFSDILNGEGYDFPVYFDLLNHDNLLPTLSDSDLIVSDEENTNVTSTPTLSLTAPDTVYIDEEAIFDVTGTVSDVSDVIPVEYASFVGNNGLYSMSVEVDNSVAKWFNLNVQKHIIQLGDTDRLEANLLDYEGNGISGNLIYFYELYDVLLALKSSTSIAQTGDVVDLNVTLKDSSDGSIVDEDSVVQLIAYNPQLFRYQGLSSTSSTDDVFVSQTGTTAMGISVASDGTTFSPSSTSNGWVWANLTGTDTNTGIADYYLTDLVVEFDVLAKTGIGTTRLNIYEAYRDGAKSSVFDVQIGHNKFIYEDGEVKHYVNGTLVTTKSYLSTEMQRIGFTCNQGTSLKIKNFIIGGY